MAEEKQEKQKPVLVWRVFKWVGLGLLSILIIAATFFHAPWKIITILLIILAACTALPKTARKWFWLSAAAVVIALIIWVFLPDDNEDWRPYTCDEELAALEAKYYIPDEENAAIIYNQLLEDYNEAAFEPNFPDPNPEYLTRFEPWLSKDYPKLAEWIKGHENIIAKLIEASKFENCRFPIVTNFADYGRDIEILSPMRQLAFLLLRAINNDIAEGSIEQAIEKNLTILQMAKHLCQQPTAIEVIVGIGIERLSTKQLRNLVVTCDATEEHLRVIENYLAKIEHDWSCEVHKFIEHDKLMKKSTLSTFYQINSKGKTRLSHDPFAQFRASYKEQSDANQIEDQETIDFLNSLLYPKYWQNKLIKANTILLWFFIPSTPQKAAQIIDAAYERYYAMANPDFDWKKEPVEFPITSLFSRRARFIFPYMAMLWAHMSEGSYYMLHDLYLQAAADNKGSRLIIELRRYKNKNSKWPESLDDIKSIVPEEIFVDPLNNDSFIHKLTDDGFTIYSKGKNNIDEAGEYETELAADYSGHKVKKDDQLIWPRQMCQKQSKEINVVQPKKIN